MGSGGQKEENKVQSIRYALACVTLLVGICQLAARADTPPAAVAADNPAYIGPPPVPSEDEFLQMIRGQGIDKALVHYQEVRKHHPGVLIFTEDAMNNLGHELLGADMLDEALAVFRLNVDAYPDRWNTYDSYAHASMIKGDIDAALANFRYSLKLNPDNAFGARYAKILQNYTKHEYMIPMRDGVRLCTQVYAPRNTSRTCPFLILRTPYSIGHYAPTDYRDKLGPDEVYVDEGFIFVYQDVRGQAKSEGDFAIMRPPAKRPRSARDTDEGTDLYDTIEWLLENVPGHNGRVGQWGGSYSAWEGIMGLLEPHPALCASVLRAPPADMWIGDDFHHNGAFRLMYTFSFVDRSGRPRPGPGTTIGPWYDYGTRDGYKFFLDLGPVASIASRCFGAGVPVWDEYMQHGDYDEYWQERNVLPYLPAVTHPVLTVAGWFDAEDFYGPMSVYRTIEANAQNNRSTLVVGPWRHGGWSSGKGDRLFDVDFGTNTAEYFRKEVEFPFLLSHLKGDGRRRLPEALVFETGTNAWRSLDQWPPESATERRLFFHAGGGLSFEPQGAPCDGACDSYVSDPDKPVPWSMNIQTQQGHQWMIADQRFAAWRPDVLVYESEVLTEDVTIAGPITAHLSVATTGTDADFIVKLIDVFPSNARSTLSDYQMLLSAEVMRAKYRRSFERPEPMTPGAVTEIEFELPERYHCFLEGHRIMVQVQSTWFPVIDRNPQTFVNIYRASEEDFQPATHTVHCSESYPSYLTMRVLSKSGQ